jgi:Xaa-Pro aminopeptidase
MADYKNLDRTMQAGELVRVDVGCDFDLYKGDLGRTVPVSGRFDAGQREVLAILNDAYLAGVQAIKPRATPREVFDATAASLGRHTSQAKSDLAREAIASALKTARWTLHGLGLDVWESAPEVFSAGNVLCYEPFLVAGGQAFFVEDTILVTAEGNTVLNAPLPYSPEEIEQAMQAPRKSR